MTRLQKDFVKKGRAGDEKQRELWNKKIEYWYSWFCLRVFCGFYEFSAMFMVVMLVTGLIIVYKRNGYLKIPKTMEFAGVLIITVMYLLTIFYGVDSGTSVFGFMKIVPVTGTILTVAAITLYPFETTREFLFQAERFNIRIHMHYSCWLESLFCFI